MPLTERGRAIIQRLPNGVFRAAGPTGCAIVRHDELCVGCGRCTSVCPSGATRCSDIFDPAQLLSAPADSRRGALAAALGLVAQHPPLDVIEVPPRVRTFRSVVYDDTICLGCGACARACPIGAIEALPATKPMTAAPDPGPVSPSAELDGLVAPKPRGEGDR